MYCDYFVVTKMCCFKVRRRSKLYFSLPFNVITTLKCVFTIQSIIPITLLSNFNQF